MLITKEKKFLKDSIAKKVLSSEECREYLIHIIALSLDLDIDEVKENLKLVDTHVSNYESLKNQETDLILENDKNVFNIEINYNYYEDGMIKNHCYIANIMIRQFKKGKSYKKYKSIKQINLNNYDFFQKGEFLYRSSVIEEKYQIKRDEMFEIIDINLDFLSNLDYTEIKKLDERDLKWLLYIFVCSSKEERKKIYQENPLMRSVYERMDELTKNLNEMLYYDPEEFRKQAEYNEGHRDGIAKIALKMMEKGLTIDEIREYTGLTKKEIENLKAG